jgi:hypothetical protein
MSRGAVYKNILLFYVLYNPIKVDSLKIFYYLYTICKNVVQAEICVVVLK